MRWPEIALLIIASLGLFDLDFLQGQRPLTKLTAGFWFWRGSSTDITWSGETLDVLFVHAGTIRDAAAPYAALYAMSRTQPGPWHVDGRLPKDLPSARDYWLVFRCERQSVPGLTAAPLLAAEVSRLREEAQARNLNVVGVQLDVDSPTGALSQYAGFLHEVRKNLPAGLQLSITALLDWFRAGTSIAEVIQQVDEFVPQFYDVADFDADRRHSIAASVDPAQWGPMFNRFGKRFRIGISTFGRARLVRKDVPSGSSKTMALASYFGDVTPLDIAANGAFRLQASQTGANELTLSYLATRQAVIAYNHFAPGEIVQFNLATAETVHSAVQGAGKMGGHLSGVVFFRWPAANETLAMQPDEVLLAAGFKPATHKERTNLLMIDGGCASVKCVDLFLEDTSPLSSQPLRYRIRSSIEFEYFLPGERMPVRMAGPSEVELSLPPYCGRGRMYIGRAVTTGPAEFSLEKQ